MADTILQSTPQSDTEYKAAFSFYIAETQHLLDQMATEQAEYERLKATSVSLDVEMQSLKMQTQEILTRLEATI